MKWFGESWGAPVCQPEDHVAGLPDAPCTCCNRAFVEGDIGVIVPLIGGPGDPKDVGYHHACFMESLGLSKSA